MGFQCLKPLIAVSLYKDENNKNVIKFLPPRVDYNLFLLRKRYGDENVFVLPCGQCESCRRNYAEEWSIRCSCEMYDHKYNYFITLTYDELHVHAACWKDFSKFLDRLEGRGHKNKFKYFACMEYGELTQRPHFHAILFMDEPLTLEDGVMLDGFMHYHSKELTDKWNLGLHDISEVDATGGCSRYVAKYCNKGTSIDGKKRSSIRMSRNLGLNYLLTNLDSIREDTFTLYGKFGNQKFHVGLPKNFLRLLINKDVQGALAYHQNRKKLGHLTACYGLRNLGIGTEELLILNKQQRAKDKKTKGRML